MDRIKLLEQQLTDFMVDLQALEGTMRALTEHYMATGYAHTLVQLAEANEDKRLMVAELKRIKVKLEEAQEQLDADTPRDNQDPLDAYKSSRDS